MTHVAYCTECGSSTIGTAGLVHNFGCSVNSYTLPAPAPAPPASEPRGERCGLCPGSVSCRLCANGAPYAPAYCPHRLAGHPQTQGPPGTFNPASEQSASEDAACACKGWRANDCPIHGPDAPPEAKAALTPPPAPAQGERQHDRCLSCRQALVAGPKGWHCVNETCELFVPIQTPPAPPVAACTHGAADWRPDGWGAILLTCSFCGCAVESRKDPNFKPAPPVAESPEAKAALSREEFECAVIAHGNSGVTLGCRGDGDLSVLRVTEERILAHDAALRAENERLRAELRLAEILVSDAAALRLRMAELETLNAAIGSERLRSRALAAETAEKRLTEALRDAPHAPLCGFPDADAITIDKLPRKNATFHAERGPCDCWKSRALGAK